MTKTKRTAQFLVSLWLVMTVVPLLFGNFEGAATKFVGVGAWVGIIVGVVAIIEKIVLISKNRSDAASRNASSTTNDASASHKVQPTELKKAVVDIVTEKHFREQEIKSAEAEIETATARFGKQSSSLRPLGNLTYQEASRYFTEYCELMERGCGMREKESSLPTSLDRMKALPQNLWVKGSNISRMEAFGFFAFPR